VDNHTNGSGWYFPEFSHSLAVGGIAPELVCVTDFFSSLPVRSKQPYAKELREIATKSAERKSPKRLAVVSAVQEVLHGTAFLGNNDYRPA